MMMVMIMGMVLVMKPMIEPQRKMVDTRGTRLWAMRPLSYSVSNP